LPTYTPLAPADENKGEAFHFALTRKMYTEMDAELETACAQALGAEWRTADWDDIVEYVQSGNVIQDLAAELKLEENISYWATFEGESWYSDQRHYFIEMHNHNLPDGWLSHAEIDDHFLDLGSWYDIEASVICFLGDETPIVAEQEQEAEPAEAGNQTPEAPPTIALRYYGSYPCGEWPNYAVFELESTSIWILQSAGIEIFDTTNNTSVYAGTNDRPFLKEGECPPGDTILPPYNTRYVAANIREPEVGTQFAAAITLCTEEGLEGQCVTESIEFIFGEQSQLEGTSPTESSQPTGEPGFEVQFAGTHPCGNHPHYAAFDITNTSTHTFESVSLIIDDTTNDKHVYGGSNNQGFVEAGGCPPGDSSLQPGSALQVAANIRIPEPGTAFEATIKLCTQDDVEGQCASETITFIFEE
jgi:hypothetical protein